MDFPAVGVHHPEDDDDYGLEVLPRLKDLHVLCDTVADSLHSDYGRLDVYDLLGSIAFYLTAIGVSIEVDVRVEAEAGSKAKLHEESRTGLMLNTVRTVQCLCSVSSGQIA